MAESQKISGYSRVQHALADLLARGSVPPGCKGALFTAVDELTMASAPHEHLEIAKLISIAIHKLEWATLRNDIDARADMRDQLSAFQQNWSTIVAGLQSDEGCVS